MEHKTKIEVLRSRIRTLETEQHYWIDTLNKSGSKPQKVETCRIIIKQSHDMVNYLNRLDNLGATALDGNDRWCNLKKKHQTDLRKWAKLLKQSYEV